MKVRGVTEAAGIEVHTEVLTVERFEASPELRRFKGIMRSLLKIPKSELDHRVRMAKAISLRAGNPNAPGRKAKPGGHTSRNSFLDRIEHEKRSQ